MDCPNCNAELEATDTFGNIDYCLDAIGHPRGEFDRPRRPVKRGNIYRCLGCDEQFHTFDGDVNIHHGYPC